MVNDFLKSYIAVLKFILFEYMPNYEEKALNIIKDYVHKIKKFNFEATNPVKANYCYKTDIIDKKEKVSLLVYFSAKGNKIVLQGNKELNLYRKLYEIIFGEQLFSFDKDDFVEPDVYIGTDESGKGDYFGPLVIAAVFSDKPIRMKLKALGVKDSKELSDYKINEIARKIKSIEGIVYSTIIINPGKYNLLHSKMKNVNKILGWAHAKALENILEKKSVPEAISDKFGDEKYIFTSLQSKGKSLILHQKTKAEKYIGVAAASIIARSIVNYWFARTSKEMKMKIPKGASEIVKQTASKIKNEFGIEKLNELVKIHFKTTTKI